MWWAQLTIILLVSRGFSALTEKTEFVTFEEKDLVFNHVPKTGGSSLQYFSRDKEQDFAACNIYIREIKTDVNADGCLTKSGIRSKTNTHCFHSRNDKLDRYIKLHPFHTFCVIRQPIERFMSSYNFRHVIERVKLCSEESIDRYIKDYLAVGDVDNHDVPQVSYHCGKSLCYEDLTNELFALFRERGCNENITSHTVLSPQRIRRSNTKKVHACSVYNISCAGIKLLEDHYREDIQLHNTVCRPFYSSIVVGDNIATAKTTNVVQLVKAHKKCEQV